MDASDLIYVAIVLIGLISGFIKNRKKEAQPNKTSKGTLDYLIKEFIDPDTKTTTPNNTENSYTPFVEKQKPSYTDSIQKAAPLDYENLEHSEKTNPPIIKEPKTNFNQKNELLQRLQESEFDLREAIIHNTILNRPEY